MKKLKELKEIERLSEKQISKIEKEFDFFIEKGYEITDEHRTYTPKGNYYVSYVLEKKGIFHKVECSYDVSVFGRIKRVYNLLHCIDNFIITDNTTSFDNMFVFSNKFVTMFNTFFVIKPHKHIWNWIIFF